MTSLRRERALLAHAWRFLTRVPLPGPAAPTGAADMAAALRYLPAVGAVVGLAGAAVLLAAARFLPIPVAVLLSLAATIALTGALHEDGLADSFDALGAATRERALEIMRDSRLGTFGVLALGLVLATKATALALLPLATAAVALVAAHSASRLSAVLVIATSRYVRATGTGSFTTRHPSPRALAVAALPAVLCLAALAAAAGPGTALAGLAGLFLGHVAARLSFERRLGGYTGDGLGATQQLSELGLYLGALAWL